MSMAILLDSNTHVTLLERLAKSGTPDEVAWKDFVEHYGRKIYQWCLHWKLQDADALDVTQAVLLKVAERIKDFHYDPARSFRAWLKTVSHHAWRDYVDSQQRAGQADDRDCLHSLEAREDMIAHMEQEFDRELFQLALHRVRLRVLPHNWQAFCLTALEGLPAAGVAKQLEMKIARVYAARSTVQQLLREECQRLEAVDP